MQHLIGKTRNKVPVYVDLIRSLAAMNISRQPRLLNLVKEVVQLHTATGDTVVLEYDMGRDVGYSYIVPTTSSDTIFYAKILRESVYSRFVKQGKPRVTSKLTVVLKQDEKGSYELHNTWIGENHPPRPGSDDATAESAAFWDSHAFVLDKQPLQTSSITKTCPY